MSEIYKVKYNDIDYLMIQLSEYEGMKKSVKMIIDQNKTLFEQNNKLVENLKIYKKDVESCIESLKSYDCECDFCIINREDA